MILGITAERYAHNSLSTARHPEHRGTCILICEGQVRQHINRWALSGSRRAQMAWLTGISLLLNGPRWIAARELPFGITMENTDHYVLSYRYGRRGLKFGAEKEAMWSTSKKMRDFEATMVIIVILIIHPLDTQLSLLSLFVSDRQARPCSESKAKSIRTRTQPASC